MIPPEYSSFFSTMAGVGATLFGLIFVAISIAPENLVTPNASLDRQVRATASYLALLNPLVISLLALIPHQQIGIVTLVMSTLGLLNTLGMLLTLLRSAGVLGTILPHSLFILGGFFLYGYESFFALRLIKYPTDPVSLYFLADLLIFISIFGVIRAWELIGIRRFLLLSWIASIIRGKDTENRIDPESARLDSPHK